MFKQPTHQKPVKSRSWKNSAQPIALNVCLNEQMNAAARKIDTKIKKEAKTVNNQILLYFITNNLSNCTIVKIIYYFVQLGKALSLSLAKISNFSSCEGSITTEIISIAKS